MRERTRFRRLASTRVCPALCVLVTALGLVGLTADTARTAAPRFYSDDPIWKDPESQDA